ncbi:MAG: VWA domain-containing protein [bacterium]|nr:VWA domain-containing protein [bacterium]
MHELDDLEFAVNTEPRCPCLLVLDTSSSMNGDPIRELNAGLAAFQDDINQDELARKRAEIALVTFGGTVEVAQDFVTVEGFQAPTLVANGNTPMGEAVHRGLDLLRARKDEYKANRINYYRPWMFLITDGVPTDEWKQAAADAAHAEANRELILYAIGVRSADFRVLAEFSPEREPLQLKGLSFREFFQWLSQSQKRVSSSNPGDEVQLPAPTGWGTAPTST